MGTFTYTTKAPPNSSTDLGGSDFASDRSTFYLSPFTFYSLTSSPHARSGQAEKNFE